MPKNARSTRLRELERSYENLEHPKVHMMRILQEFTEATINIADTGNDIDDTYVEIMELLQLSIQGCELIQESLKKILELI